MDINDSLQLKLSSYAAYILNCDKGAFMIDAKQRSPFINKIVKNYWAESNAMTEPTEKFNYQGNVQIRLQLNTNLSNELGDMIDLPSNINIVKLYSYNNKFSAAKFIAAILEEYALLPFVERERIFYCDVFEKLLWIITDNNPKNKKIAVCETTSGNSIEIYPVRICMDEWSTYNYLIGLVFDKKRQEIVPICMRISRIKSVVSKKATNYFSEIGEAHITRLDEDVNEFGVMFLSTESKLIRVKIRFTKRGKWMYDTMHFMRPPYTETESNENGECVMTFICTERQIENYFLKFGKDAEIIKSEIIKSNELIEPGELREKFLSFYREAYKMYSGDQTDI